MGWIEYSQAEGIGVEDGTSLDICKRIDSTVQANRIGFNVTADRRIVVSVSVLMQSRLPIEDLPSEPYVVGNCSSRRASSYPTAISPVRSRTWKRSSR